MEKNHRLHKRVRHLEQKLRTAQWQIDQLTQRLIQLEQKLNRNSRNSSLPPSANPPSAPPAVNKQPTGRKIGAQKGHPGHFRKPLPPEQVDQFIEHRPAQCEHCQARLPTIGGEVAGRHQVMELPLRAVTVTEHQSWSVQCPCCQGITRGVIPPFIRVSVVGERLSAALCLLSSRLHGSRRAAAELLQEVLGAPLSLGSISARENEMSRALAGDYQKLKAQVKEALIKHVDETGWKRAAGFLWVAATDDAAVFHLDRGRHRGALQKLLGEQIQGWLCTDRYGPYEQHPPDRRQLCWSHLKRDFRAQQERAGPAGRWGSRALKLTHQLFELWHRFKHKHIARSTLQRMMRPVKKRLHRLLKQGAASSIEQLTGLCANLLRLEKALWNFARVEGLEPTNNHAERMLRPAVQWRKKSLGSHSEQGCRFAERMLSVIQTCRLRGQSVMSHLQKALANYRQELTPCSAQALQPFLNLAA
jgi:transposase